MHNMLRAIIKLKKKDLLYKKNRKFRKAIEEGKHPAIIGELKFASPTNSQIGDKDSLFTKAKEYQEAGLEAISVITERHYFKGDTSFIPLVKEFTTLPVLQKDFIIDDSQIFEAKALGSDALLFIARILSEEVLQKFVSLALSLGIEPVVEIASGEDLKKAVKTETQIMAVNARDLDTFTVDVVKACLLCKKIPPQFMRLGFSGITSQREIKLYTEAGARGVLIGTSLMKAPDTSDFIRNLKL